jgi:hypothetical protein
MTHRLVLFNWLVRDEKEVLDIVEHPFDSLEEATSFLDTLAESEYQIAKIFVGDSLVHTRDRKKQHHDQNFS